MLRLSQTMIVKNEERNIEKSLSWGRNIAFEQIVVDTGSVDKTVEKAQKLGAKVYHFKWVDDFSAAKNYALDLCSGDWIAILDADEYFTPTSVKILMDIIETADKNGYEAIRTSLTSIDGKGGIINKTTHIRLIKNIKHLRYKRRIHEILCYPGTIKIYEAQSELDIIHTGYIEEVAKKKRSSKRNRNLLIKELAENPDDYELLGYLADDYALENRDKAINIYQKAIQLLPDKIDIYDTRTADTFTKLIILLSLDGRDTEITDLCDKAEQIMSVNADFSYYTGLFFYSKKEYSKAFNYYKKAFDKLNKDVNNVSENLISNISIAYAQYGHILYELQDFKNSVAVESSVLKENKKEYVALLTILKAFKSVDTRADMVMDYLNKIYDFTETLDKLIVYRASKEIDYKDIIDGIFNMFNEKEIKFLEEDLNC